MLVETLGAVEDQEQRYRDFYKRWRRLRWLLRFDVRYRCRRLVEVLSALGVGLDGRRVLDVGFGGGHLLRVFPKSCELSGAEISRSAVEVARSDPAYAEWKCAHFALVRERYPEDLPRGPFDVIVSSHTLEHVPSDAALLDAIRSRLSPGGVLCVFVPVEEPNYNPDHVRVYTVDSCAALVARAGFDVVFTEGSLHTNGHVWKLLTIPSRRRWPVLKPIADAFRGITLSSLPYGAHRFLDDQLDRLGVGPRQALVIARPRR